MPHLTDFTDINYIKFLKATNKFDAITELAEVFRSNEDAVDFDSLVNYLFERERLMSTGIGFGIAIPHIKVKGVKRLSFAIGVSQKGIDFDSMDDQLVKLVLMVVAPENQQKEYLNLLANIMNILKNLKLKEKITSAKSIEEIFNIFNAEISPK